MYGEDPCVMNSNCVWQTEGSVFDLEAVLWRAVGAVLIHKDVKRKDIEEKSINSSNWTQLLDPERDGKRDWESEHWGKDKRLWPGQENTLLNRTHMLWPNGVVAQGHRQQQQQQHVKKVFHPDLTSNLREREEERMRGWTEMTERLCVWSRVEKRRRKRDGKIWLTSKPSVH